MTMKQYFRDLLFVIFVGMSLFFLVFLIVLGFSSMVNGAPPTTYRDRLGRTVGSSTTSGGITVYRDRVGRTIGSATTSRDNTTYRDRSGRTILQQSGNNNYPVPFFKKGKK